MPSFDLYRKYSMGGNGKTLGQVRKDNSDMIMEVSWDGDIDARIGYFYDQDHDDEFEVMDNLHPERSMTKIPVEIKLFEMEYNSLSKDEVAYHIMFKPSYKPNIPYYDEKFAKPFKSIFPIGMYMDACDSQGIFHRWLVVGQYRHYSNQFPTYLVLPCDHKLQWIYKSTKYESWGVLRSQSSYNQGTWVDYRFRSVENQKLMWLPMSEYSKTIFYDTRVIISEPREIPVCWRCSKVEDMNVKGIARYTFAQDLYDEHHDYIEKDEDGNVIGMWADYFTSGITPTDQTEPENKIYSVVTIVGKAQQIKVGGSYKTFRVTFYDGEEETDFRPGVWSYFIDGQDASGLVTESTTGLAENQIKIKFKGGDEYISKNLIVRFTSDDGIASEVEVNIVGL